MPNPSLHLVSPYASPSSTSSEAGPFYSHSSPSWQNRQSDELAIDGDASAELVKSTFRLTPRLALDLFQTHILSMGIDATRLVPLGGERYPPLKHGSFLAPRGSSPVPATRGIHCPDSLERSDVCVHFAPSFFHGALNRLAFVTVIRLPSRPALPNSTPSPSSVRVWRRDARTVTIHPKSKVNCGRNFAKSSWLVLSRSSLRLHHPSRPRTRSALPRPHPQFHDRILTIHAGSSHRVGQHGCPCLLRFFWPNVRIFVLYNMYVVLRHMAHLLIYLKHLNIVSPVIAFASYHWSSVCNSGIKCETICLSSFSSRSRQIRIPVEMAVKVQDLYQAKHVVLVASTAETTSRSL